MRLRCLVVALAFVTVFASDSWARSKHAPVKRDQQQNETQEQKAATDQRGTEQLPLIVQPLPTKKNAEITEQEKREAKEKTDSDWWTRLLGILTIVALFGQLVVFIAQAYFLKGTLTATAEAANAALRQVNASVALEAPNPVIVKVKLAGYRNETDQTSDPENDPVKPGQPPTICRILVAMQNIGRTDMKMIDSSIDWIVAATLRPIPDYTRVVSAKGGIFRKGDPVWLWSDKHFIKLTDEERSDMQSGRKSLWAYGYFSYFNFVGERFEIGFLARWNMSEGFVREVNPNYEYNRQTNRA
jgi:hypothetical protein